MSYYQYVCNSYGYSRCLLAPSLYRCVQQRVSGADLCASSITPDLELATCPNSPANIYSLCSARTLLECGALQVCTVRLGCRGLGA